MSLFQNSVVNRQLQVQDKAKLALQWKVFKNHFHNNFIQDNIRSSKEEQYQGEFLIDLFVNVLGYTKNPSPNYNLTTEYKNTKDSKKADGAILVNSKVKAVIELKGTNTTDLGKIEVQAFGYKNNQADCVYVITSNFEKLRFYIDNATEFLEFNMFRLTEKEFELFYLCLAYENISKDVPKKLKEQSTTEEKNITKYLYTDYSLFKRELHQNLVARNPDVDPLELFQKSQKLLDRFLFIFFAEDRNLLPTNLIFRINKEWRQLQEMRVKISLYDRYKTYFHDLNKGAKVVLPAFSQTMSHEKEEHQIFAYNGGLFQPDDVLDIIDIDDELLFGHTQKLSKYDFASEIDVNILGHIFENSLNELDEIKAQLEGTTLEKSVTKRKKDGVFYTPKYITKYIVESTIGKLCVDKKKEFKIFEEEYFSDKKRNILTKKPLSEKLTKYRKWLLDITICDPACGSGAFLNQALDFLIAEHRYIDELQAKLLGEALVLSDVEKSILENNLFGVDLNEESVEIAKLSLWLRTARPNRKLNDLNNNIKCGNSLIDDINVADEKAFNWKKEFPEIFEMGGFDVVIGNPPYVNIVNIQNRDEREFYQKNYQTLKNKSDLYSIFVEKGYEILKNNGIFSFIFPNSWLGTESFSEFRRFLINYTSIKELIKLPNDVFHDAVVTPVILSFEKEFSEDNSIVLKEYVKDEFLLLPNSLSYSKIKKSETFTFSFGTEIKINVDSIKLGEIAKFSLGIKTSDDKRFILNKKIDDDCYPIIRGRNISKYYYSEPTEWIWYKPNLITEKAGGRPRVLENFLSQKIYIQDISKSINACLCNQPILANDTLNVIYEAEKGVSLETILALLNSKLINKWFEAEFQEGLHIKINQLQQIPIAKSVFQNQTFFSEKVSLLGSLNKELYEKSQKFQRVLRRKFELTALPKKLQEWYLLDYPTFIKELTRQKIKLSLSQEVEWEEYFVVEAKKLLGLKIETDCVKKEIDDLIYQLYNLAPEEIAIIEKS